MTSQMETKTIDNKYWINAEVAWWSEYLIYRPQHGEVEVEWLQGDWISGVWNYGDWKGGFWRSGIWNNGVWRKGVWLSGTWEKGFVSLKDKFAFTETYVSPKANFRPKQTLSLNYATYELPYLKR